MQQLLTKANVTSQPSQNTSSVSANSGSQHNKIICHYCHKSGHEKSKGFALKNKLKRENHDPIPTRTTPTMSQNEACDSAQVVYNNTGPKYWAETVFTSEGNLRGGLGSGPFYDYTNRLSVQRGIFLPIEILEQEIDFLLDTGADITLISIGT